MLEARRPLSQGGASLQACHCLSLEGHVSAPALLLMSLLQLGFTDQELQFVRVVAINLLQQLMRLLRIDLVEALGVLQQVIGTPLVVAL